MVRVMDNIAHLTPNTVQYVHIIIITIIINDI